VKPIKQKDRMMDKIIVTTILTLLSLNTSYAKEIKLIVKEVDSDRFKSITVDESEVESIKTDSKYLSVEEEIWVKIPTPKPTKRIDNLIPHGKSNVQSKSSRNTGQIDEQIPNDPELSGQYYFQDKSLFQGSSEILKGMNKSIQNKKLRIAVIDGGFHDHPDMEWSYGYNFFDEFGEVRQPEFRDFDDEVSEATGCISGHGLGVASIIGAKSNNNIGISGVIDADIIALRALSCGIGPLSDLSDAIIHAAGGEVDDIPVIEKADMINISIAGPTGTCPNYLQEAIDFANQQGVMIFVSAGNNNEDINSYVPAICQGVYVSGATDKQGYKAEFSNYGAISSMSPGVDILGYAASYSEGEILTNTGWWEGTSQASPLALSVAALGLQHNPELTRDEIFTYLKATATPIREDVPSADQDCSGDLCGAGLIDANKFMDYVVASTNGGIYKLHHALSPESSCSQELFLSQLGNSLPLCQLYEFVIADGVGINQNSYKIVRVIKGEVMIEENAEFLLTSDEKTVLLDNIDLDSYDYGVKICLNDACDDTPIIKINIDESALPAACQ
jgi:subtilisin family serine protease